MSGKTAALILASLAPIALTACAAGQQSAEAEALTPRQLAILERELGGKVAGEPVSCIGYIRRSDMIGVSDAVLLYRASGQVVYKNDLRDSCPGLARGTNIIGGRSDGSGPCRGDIIRVIDRDSSMIGATCSLGDFTPYRVPVQD